MRFCYLCGDVLFEPIEWDHVIPKAWGDDVSANPRMPVHTYCNSRRSDNPLLSSPNEMRERLVSSTKEGMARAKAEGEADRWTQARQQGQAPMRP